MTLIILVKIGDEMKNAFQKYSWKANTDLGKLSFIYQGQIFTPNNIGNITVNNFILYKNENNCIYSR